jgi:phage gpG-like protein
MPVEIEVKLDRHRLQLILDRLHDRVGDLRPYFNMLGNIGMASIRRNFEVGGRPVRWKPLSPVTIARRIKENKWPGQILIRRGRLLRSISHRARKDRVIWSAKTVYAALQHFGARKGQFGRARVQVRGHFRKSKTGGGKRFVQPHFRTMSIPWGDVPARPYMLLQPEDLNNMADRLLEMWEFESA